MTGTMVKLGGKMKEKKKIEGFVLQNGPLKKV